MKFKVNSKELKSALSVLNSVISKAPSMPILSCVNFEPQINDEKPSFKITATDLETTLFTFVNVEFEEKTESTFSFSVDAIRLLNSVSSFEDVVITFSVSEDFNIKLKTVNGTYKMSGFNPSLFPVITIDNIEKSTTIDKSILAYNIKSCMGCVEIDKLRPVLYGIFFEFDKENIIMTATDTHKLVTIKNTIENTNDGKFILPYNSAIAITKFIEDKECNRVSISYNDKNAIFTSERFTMVCRLIEGNYPNYRAVIPTGSDKKIIVDKTTLIDACKRASIFSNISTRQIRISLSTNNITISADDLDYSNSSIENVSCIYNGEPFEIGFNAKYLISVLDNISTDTSDDIVLQMSNANKAVIIVPQDEEEGNNYIGLVMPCIINNN